jgi:hypothetical protein
MNKNVFWLMVAMAAFATADVSAQSVTQNVEIEIAQVLFIQVDGNTGTHSRSFAGVNGAASTDFDNLYWSTNTPSSVSVRANVAHEIQIAAQTGPYMASSGGRSDKPIGDFQFRVGTRPVWNSQGTALSTSAAPLPGSARSAGDWSASEDRLQVYYGLILSYEDAPATYSVPVVYTIVPSGS